MNVQVTRWGNSLAIRLPKPAAEAANIAEGDALELRVPGKGRVELRTRKRKPKLAALLAKITPENRHEEVDWGAPAGREIW
jgi:antitoxin MazE